MSTLGKVLGTTGPTKARRQAQAYIAKAAATQKPWADWGAGYIEDYETLAYAPEKSAAYAQMLSAARNTIRNTGGIVDNANMAQMGASLGMNMDSLFTGVRSSLQQSYGLPVSVGAGAARNMQSIYNSGADIIMKGYEAQGAGKNKLFSTVMEALGQAGGMATKMSMAGGGA